jgi:hypothetical protein
MVEIFQMIVWKEREITERKALDASIKSCKGNVLVSIGTLNAG